jgi:hypothetical protein
MAPEGERLFSVRRSSEWIPEGIVEGAEEDQD